MYVVFDFDGVLADTRKLVTAAYADVGVVITDDIWGRPWQEWLSDPLAHAQKNVRYLELIEKGALDNELLPGLHVMKRLHTEGVKTLILTGASLEPVAAFVDRYLHGEGVVVLGTSCGDIRKSFLLLQLLTDTEEDIVYVDDNFLTGGRIVGWTKDMRVHFVHSGEMDALELYDEVMKWTP